MDPFDGAKRKTAVETLADACTRRPALASVLSVMIPIYEARSTVLAGLVPHVLPVPALASPGSDRLGNGVPLLADADMSWVNVPFEIAARGIFPELARLESLTTPVVTYLQALEAGVLIPAEIAAACLSSDAKGIERIGSATGVSASILVFLTHQVLGLVLQAACVVSKPHVEQIQWKEGYCPVCGSFPSVGCLGRPDPDQSEFAKGGGGHKYLHCSLCGYDWRFRRGTCPGCSNEEPGAIEYMRSPQATWERIELCRKCNTYVGNVDLRETSENPNLDAAALGMMYLDMVAAKEGLHPLAPSFWNTYD